MNKTLSLDTDIIVTNSTVRNTMIAKLPNVYFNWKEIEEGMNLT